jgi:hypothetical protein
MSKLALLLVFLIAGNTSEIMAMSEEELVAPRISVKRQVAPEENTNNCCAPMINCLFPCLGPKPNNPSEDNIFSSGGNLKYGTKKGLSNEERQNMLAASELNEFLFSNQLEDNSQSRSSSGGSYLKSDNNPMKTVSTPSQPSSYGRPDTSSSDQRARELQSKNQDPKKQELYHLPQQSSFDAKSDSMTVQKSLDVPMNPSIQDGPDEDGIFQLIGPHRLLMTASTDDIRTFNNLKKEGEKEQQRNDFFEQTRRSQTTRREEIDQSCWSKFSNWILGCFSSSGEMPENQNHSPRPVSSIDGDSISNLRVSTTVASMSYSEYSKKGAKEIKVASNGATGASAEGQSMTDSHISLFTRKGDYVEPVYLISEKSSVDSSVKSSVDSSVKSSVDSDHHSDSIHSVKGSIPSEQALIVSFSAGSGGAQ